MAKKKKRTLQRNQTSSLSKSIHRARKAEGQASLGFGLFDHLDKTSSPARLDVIREMDITYDQACSIARASDGFKWVAYEAIGQDPESARSLTWYFPTGGGYASTGERLALESDVFEGRSLNDGDSRMCGDGTCSYKNCRDNDRCKCVLTICNKIFS